jgi:hypothetical protein
MVLAGSRSLQYSALMLWLKIMFVRGAFVYCVEKHSVIEAVKCVSESALFKDIYRIIQLAQKLYSSLIKLKTLISNACLACTAVYGRDIRQCKNKLHHHHSSPSTPPAQQKECIGRESNPGLAETVQVNGWQRLILPLNHRCGKEA